jgi:hypothetical protein
MMPLIPFVLIAVGGAALFIALSTSERPVPVHEPDLAPTPGSTRYKKIDAILDELKKASASSGIPLGLLVGWIAKESGGRLDEVTKLDERGLFQLMPAESKSLGLDHKRLSTDLNYSVNAGLLLIAKYMGDVDKLGVTPKGTSYYWRLVKLAHTMGTGAMNKIVAAAEKSPDALVGNARTWNALERFALAHDKELLSATKHTPSKWFPFVDEVYEVGAPFGFGSPDVVVGAGELFADIIDPLDCLSPTQRT